MTRVSHDGLSRTSRFLVVRIVPLVILLAGSLIIVFSTRDLLRASASVNWPVTPGTIVESRVVHSKGESSKPGRNKSGKSYKARIRFQFEVDGREMIGKRVAFGEISTSRETAVKRVSQYPVSAQVDVHYMPEDPDICVLEPGLRPGVFFAPGIGIIVLIVGFITANRFPRMFFDSESSTDEIS